MKEIQLTKGYVALVDDEDYEWLMQFKWYAVIKRNGNAYAARSLAWKNGKRGFEYMHRVIMKANDNEFVDHRDGNTVSNVKSNLRKCTISQNNQNAARRSNNSSSYIGVYFHKGANKFHARLSTQGEGRVSLGLFDTAIEAAVARDIVAEKYHGEFAKLNFPRQNPESTYLCAYEIRTITDHKPAVNQSGSSKTDPVCFDCQWDGTFKRC